MPLKYNIIGYGVCGPGEASRYMRETLKEFKRLCDHTVIVGNNITADDRMMINEFGFELLEDNRTWGLEQNKIKQDLMYYIARYNPNYCVCLDMDEVFDYRFTKKELVEQLDNFNSLYFYIINLWDKGWNRRQSFWNVRAWKWNGDTKIYNKPLHCGLAPEWCYYYGGYAPYFVKHYGLMKEEDRQKKIERYQKYDPQAKYKDKSYYDALAGNSSEPLDEEFIREAIKKEIGVQTKRNNPALRKKKLYYVRRITNGQDLGIIDVDETILHEVLMRNKEWINLGEIGKDTSQEVVNAPAPDKNECPICGEILASGEALLLHKQQKHG